MSDLRKQLQAAREEYLRERYSGDLAVDVLSRRAWPWGRWTAAASAIAAGLIVGIYVYRQLSNLQTTGTETIAVVEPTGEEIETSLGAVPVMTMSDVPMELVPPAYDLSFGVPSFSLSSDETTDQIPPTEEAV